MRGLAATVVTVGLLFPSAGLWAQQGGVTLLGLVTDSLGLPIPEVLVSIETRDESTHTAIDGTFSLVVVGSGEMQIALQKNGWVTRRFRFDLPGGASGVRDFGTITLAPLPSDAIVLTGVVQDDSTATTIPSVVIELNGRTVAVTDTMGQFRVVAPVDSGANRLTLRRLGYDTEQYFFQVPNGERDVHLDIRLNSSAVRLSDIGVEETGGISPRLAGFIRRQEMSVGHFFDAGDIEKMGVITTSDVVRRVPGVIVMAAGAPRAFGSVDGLSGADPLAPAFGTETKIVFTGRGTMGPGGGTCEPAYYLDGIRLSTPNIDVITSPERLAGMEVYTSNNQTPPEFASIRGADCGAIVLWSKDDIANASSAVSLGVQYGAALLGGRITRGRIGGQLVMKLAGPLEFNPAFNVIVDFPSADRFTSISGWQMLLNVRGRPFGTRSPWYVGGGLNILSVRETDESAVLPLFQGRIPTTAFPMVLTGMSLHLGVVAPFVEAHLTDLFHPADAYAVLFSGFRLAIGTN